MTADAWYVSIALFCLIFLQAIRIDHLNRMMKIQQRFLESLADYHRDEPLPPAGTDPNPNA